MISPAIFEQNPVLAKPRQYRLHSGGGSASQLVAAFGFVGFDFKAEVGAHVLYYHEPAGDVPS